MSTIPLSEAKARLAETSGPKSASPPQKPTSLLVKCSTNNECEP
jgi:hypothetical protein